MDPLTLVKGELPVAEVVSDSNFILSHGRRIWEVKHPDIPLSQKHVDKSCTCRSKTSLPEGLFNLV